MVGRQKKVETNRAQAQRYWEQQKRKKALARESMKELREQRSKGEESKRKIGRPKKKVELDEKTSVHDLF
jgi:hypothetical protein